MATTNASCSGVTATGPYLCPSLGFMNDFGCRLRGLYVNTAAEAIRGCRCGARFRCQMNEGWYQILHCR